MGACIVHYRTLHRPDPLRAKYRTGTLRDCSVSKIDRTEDEIVAMKLSLFSCRECCFEREYAKWRCPYEKVC